MKTLLLFVIVVLLSAVPSYGQTSSLTGLETANHKEIQIVIEDLRQYALDVGITEDAIRSKINLRLRQFGLRPSITESTDSGYLYINLNKLVQSYNLELSYIRNVIFEVENVQYITFGARVYTISNAGFPGTYNQIMDVLDRLLDQFISDYLDAND